MAVRIRDTGTSNNYWQWPEFMMLSFGHDVASATTFQDPTDMHFKRNVNKLRHRISPEARFAMLNLPSVEEHQDLEYLFSIIRAGGGKASGESSCTVASEHLH